MKKYISLFVSINLTIALLVGCTQTPVQTQTPIEQPSDEQNQNEAMFVPGTYEGMARGMNGDVNVSVSFTKNAIETITVGVHSETEGVCNNAMNIIPDAVIANQSLAVDAVSGSTISSAALLGAIRDCVNQAGGDSAVDTLKNRKIDSVPSAEEALEADIIVIGGGGAGLSAAITAAEQGKSVVLLEKLGFLGGSTLLSGGGLLFCTDENDDGVPLTVDKLVDYSNLRTEGHHDEKLVRAVGEMSIEVMDWLEDMGVKWTDVSTEIVGETMRIKTGDYNGVMYLGGGAGVIQPMEKKARELGVKILLNTSGTELITNDAGTVVGIKAEKKDGGIVSCKGNAVILATGGYARNKEMVQRFAPLLNDVLPIVNWSTIGNTGDGIRMAEAIGAGIVAEGETANGNQASDLRTPYIAELFVNKEGVRIDNEVEHYGRLSGSQFKKASSAYFKIFDGKATGDFEGAIADGECYKGDTIEELAAAAGIDKATFASTVKRYNDLCEKGIDEDYGKPADFLNGLTQPPFYAVNTPMQIVSTYGGIHINADAEVLDNSGNVIPGLYAAGETANGTIFYKEYTSSGLAIQHAVSTGRIAANTAIEKMK